MTERFIDEEFDPKKLHGDLASAMLDALLAAKNRGEFSEDDVERVERQIRTTHFWCEICVQILRLAQALASAQQQIVREAADVIVQAVFPTGGPDSLSDDGRAAVQQAVEDVLTAAAGAASRAGGATAARRAVRLLGIIACPDIDAHPDDGVMQYCVKPLTKQLLAGWLQTWIQGRFVGKISPKRDSVPPTTPPQLAHA